MRRAQHTSFNTLDNNIAINLLPNQKGKGLERNVKGHGPKHIQYTQLHLHYAQHQIRTHVLSIYKYMTE